MMYNYIDFSALPILESEETDTVFGIRDDGEFVRCSYYIKPQVDDMITTTAEEARTELNRVQEQLSNQINRVRRETVDLLGEAVISLSNI